ncbi:hypothetical protein LTR85_011430 [Meristemomyces frigidus]|nr:hypothetical protein LTR85_011430 [Meristemomyces frigidus]
MAGIARAQILPDEEHDSAGGDSSSIEEQERRRIEGPRQGPAVSGTRADGQDTNLIPTHNQTQRERNGRESGRTREDRRQPEDQRQADEHRRRADSSGTLAQSRGGDSIIPGHTQAQKRLDEQESIRAGEDSRGIYGTLAQDREYTRVTVGDTRAQRAGGEVGSALAGNADDLAELSRREDGHGRRLAISLATSECRGPLGAAFPYPQQALLNTGGNFAELSRREDEHGRRLAISQATFARRGPPAPALSYPQQAVLSSSNHLDDETYLRSQIPVRKARQAAAFPSTATAYGLVAPPILPFQPHPAVGYAARPTVQHHRPRTPPNRRGRPINEGGRLLRSDMEARLDQAKTMHDPTLEVRQSSRALLTELGLWESREGLASEELPQQTLQQEYMARDMATSPWAGDEKTAEPNVAIRGPKAPHGPDPSTSTIPPASTSNTMTVGQLADLAAECLEIGDDSSSVQSTPKMLHRPARSAAPPQNDGNTGAVPGAGETASGKSKSRNPFQHFGHWLQKTSQHSPSKRS